MLAPFQLGPKLHYPYSRSNVFRILSIRKLRTWNQNLFARWQETAISTIFPWILQGFCSTYDYVKRCLYKTCIYK